MLIIFLFLERKKEALTNSYDKMGRTKFISQAHYEYIYVMNQSTIFNICTCIDIYDAKTMRSMLLYSAHETYNGVHINYSAWGTSDKGWQE